MSGTGPQSQLIDEAIDLVIRLQVDAADTATRDEIAAFRARGAEHEAVWEKVAGVHGATGKVLSQRRVSRRTVVAGGLVALIGGGTAAATLPGLLERAGADFATGKGEIARFTLPDGSVATLGPGSAIALEFGTAQRRTRLIEGTGFFDVVPDISRPFTVAARQTEVTALGTAFDVSEDGGQVSVAVDHGSVAVRHAGAETRLTDLEWLRIDERTAGTERGTRATGEVAAWRDRLIIADGEPLAALIGRIGRWLPQTIVTVDPFVGDQVVSGIFDMSQPMRALQAAVHPAGAQVRDVAGLFTVISPI